MLRDLRMRPRAAVVMPLPTELTTPPVTKMYFGMLSCGAGEAAKHESGISGDAAHQESNGPHRRSARLPARRHDSTSFTLP